MKIVKLFLISVVCIFLLFTGIALFIPSRITISKATDIFSSGDSVMTMIKHPERWKDWYPGADTLPLLFIHGKVRGIVLHETGKQGLMITGITDSTVEATNMGDGIRRQMQTVWRVISSDDVNHVTVQWSMKFRLNWYPWEKFSSLFYENIYGVEMEKGLTALRQRAEQTVRQ